MFKYSHIVQFCNIESYISENGNIISGRSKKNSFEEPKLYKGNLYKNLHYGRIKAWDCTFDTIIKAQLTHKLLCLKLMSKENNEPG